MQRVCITIGLAMAAATPLLAQGAPPAPRPPLTRADFVGRVDRAFAEIDADHDGAITPGELADWRYARMREREKQHRDRKFAQLDADRDGALSRGEFEAVRPHGPADGHGGGHGHGGTGGLPFGRPGWFEQADANGDGRVTLAEARTAAAALFDRMDTNHDGTIGPDEHGGGWRQGRGGPAGDMPPPARG